jgi:hypothetical protein
MAEGSPTHSALPLLLSALPSPEATHPLLGCCRRGAGEHANRTCRRLHVAGTSAVVAVAAAAALTRAPSLLLALPPLGYGAAWLGHLFFERNRPATFKYPLWSLVSDFQLWWARRALPPRMRCLRGCVKGQGGGRAGRCCPGQQHRGPSSWPQHPGSLRGAGMG